MLIEEVGKTRISVETSATAGFTKNTQLRVHIVGVERLQARGEVMDDLQRLVVLTAAIELLNEAIIIVPNEILGKVEGVSHCQGVHKLDLMSLIIHKFPLLLLMRLRKGSELSSGDCISASNHASIGSEAPDNAYDPDSHTKHDRE
jgi:hypothetical protein